MAHCKAKTRLTAPVKKNSMHKIIQRNVEQPPTCGAVLKMDQCCGQAPSCEQRGQAEQFRAAPSQSKDDRYTTPQLNTSLYYASQIDAVEALQPQKYKSIVDLTPRSKATILPKLTQKLNFNADQVVFKNLTPVNVNDSILLPKHATCIRKKFVKSANKIPVPELCDFLEPLRPLEHTIPEPEVTLEFSDQSFDPFGSYLCLLD